MNDTFLQEIDRAVEIATRHEKDLLRYPGVVAVGAGPERREGKLTGRAALVVTVRTKTDPASLAAGGALPDTLEGLPVDVVERGKPAEAAEIVAAQQKAALTLARLREEWLRRPNIVGLGVGYKRVGGEHQFNRIALQVFVREKLSQADLAARQIDPVPKEIDGIPTDVVEMATLRPASSASGSRDDRKDPLVGGITVGVNTKPFWYGTLGALVFDRTTGQQLVLSNQHVLDGPAGTEVVQPSPIGLDDSLEIGFQLDVCNPLHFFRLDTPNTTVGSILAGAAAGAILAAALSDEIDPTRRGQDATPPPPGARTLLERQQVKIDYPELPIPGTHFKVKTSWGYTRHTDAGDQSLQVSEEKTNPHVLADKLLLIDRKLYHPGDTIRLFGLILPETCVPRQTPEEPNLPLHDGDLSALVQPLRFTPPTLTAGARNHRLTIFDERGQPAASGAPSDHQSSTAAAILRQCRCDRYHLTAILTPTTVDRAFPVVLRAPVHRGKQDLLVELLDLVRALDDKKLLERVFRLIRYGCIYTGALTVGDMPLGPWKHYLFVQTVNVAPAHLSPLQAAQIIGGLPVSQNTRPNLDVACGPFVVEDGQFDVELL